MSVNLSLLCWSGWCPGCGRALISATTPSTVAVDHFYCSRECRDAHALDAELLARARRFSRFEERRRRLRGRGA